MLVNNIYLKITNKIYKTNFKEKNRKIENKYVEGTKRIKTSDLKEYVRKNNSWIQTNEINPTAKKIIEKYSKENKLDILIDENDDEFLVGYLNSNEIISGKRIKILPDGKTLARGGFSIFAKNLKFNTNKKINWDVSYENDSGLKTYLYSQEKVEHEREKKTKIVNSFIREFPKILEKLEKDLTKKKKIEYLALYTIIKTYMRVGNIEYYYHYKHKGLTTLQKKDIKIANNNVIFNFIGKDGVPQNITKEFSDIYVRILSDRLKELKSNDFVFAKDNHPIHSLSLSKIMFNYTNKHFYPHIIRSFYADLECRKFIKNHSKGTSKKKVLDKFREIAKNLGHKKYSKKKEEWIIDYSVTLKNYIRPQYVSKMKSLYEIK